MKCMACGAENGDKARFCASCGAGLADKGSGAPARGVARGPQLTEEGLGRQLELRDCRAELDAWRGELAASKRSFIVCAVVGALIWINSFQFLARASTSEIGVVLSFMAGFFYFFGAYGVSWIWGKARNGGWFIFGSTQMFVILFALVVAVAIFIGIPAFIWKRKSITTAQESIEYLEARIAELEAQATAARASQ